MAFLDPFAVDGATIHGAQLRQHLYQTVKGETGVLSPESLRVEALPGSPGVVGIMSGVGVISVPSRYESYQISNRSLDGNAILSVPTAGSGGATHYVIVEVTDPEYHGSSPATTPRLVSSLSGLTRPYMALARINLTSGETVNTTSSITNLRRVANPRSLRRTQTFTISTPQALNSTSNTYWPSEAVWNVDVPEWAAVHKIRADVTNIVNLDANFEGYLEVIISSTVQATARIDIVWGGATGRSNLVVAGETPVGVEHRGGTVPVRLRARRSAGSGWLNATNLSQVIYDIEFTEAAL